MSGSVINLGYVRASNGPGFASVPVNNQRVSHIGPNLPSKGNSPAKQYIAYSVSGWVGRNSGAAVMRYGIWAASSSSAAPGALLARSNEFSPTVTYVDGAGGELMTVDLETPVIFNVDDIICLGIGSRAFIGSVAMYAAIDISQSNEQFYTKTISGTTLQDASGSANATQGQLALYTNGEYNGKPNKPGAATVTAGAGTLQPTLKCTFSDPNETLNNGVAFDRLEKVRIETYWGDVRRDNTTYTATTTERDGKYSERQVPVTGPYDTAITVKVYHIDRGGLESIAREYTFTVPSPSTGAVAQATAPTGFITNLSNPGTISNVYTNSGGLSANAVRYQLRDQNGNELVTSGIIAKSVSPGAAFTSTWAASTLGTLNPGTVYQLVAQARDTGSNWTAYSPAAVLITDSAPSTPSLYGPTNASTRGSVPDLSVRFSDPDVTAGRQLQAALSATAYILNSSNVQIGSVALTYQAGNAVTNLFTASAAAVGAVITGYDTYSWYVVASDGFLTTTSPTWSFTYAAAPVVTITSPAGPNVTTSQPGFTWSVTTQTKYRVYALNGDGVRVYDTGEVTSGAKNHIVSLANWIGGERWNNTELFTWYVEVFNGTLWGSSAPRALTLSYTPPSPVNIREIAAKAFPGVEGTHYVQASIDQPSVSVGSFLETVVSRAEISGPGGDTKRGTYIERYMVATNITDVLFQDFDVTSNTWYRYGFMVRAINAGDLIESTISYAEMMVSWWGLLIHVATNPLDGYFHLQYGDPGYATGRFNKASDVTVQPINAAYPITFSGRNRSGGMDGTYTIIGDPEDRTATQKLNDFWELYYYQFADTSPDGRPHTLCAREGRGGREGRQYGRIPEPKATTRTTGMTERVQFNFVRSGNQRDGGV